MMKSQPHDPSPPLSWPTLELCYHLLVAVVLLPLLMVIYGWQTRASMLSWLADSHWDVTRMRLLGVARSSLLKLPYDNYDLQWRAFRGSLVLLSVVALVHVIVGREVRGWRRKDASTRGGWVTGALVYQLVVGLIYLSYLHGAGALFTLLFVMINYAFSRMAASERVSAGVPGLTWAMSIGLLFLNDRFGGYKWAWLDPRLGFLDGLKGESRWHVHFPIVSLRMISFNMDAFWSARASSKEAVAVELKERKAAGDGWCADGGAAAVPLTLRERERGHRPLSDYHLLGYLAYVVYSPLYLAGPILTYNAFISQMASPAHPPRRHLAMYLARWVACVLLMDAFLCVNWSNALISNQRMFHQWAHVGVGQLAVGAFTTLGFIWLKFLVIWRFFRLWAMADGVETHENMGRCVYNNYSTEEFWRTWHRSFNQWLVRYIYLPLGGGKWKALNIWVVFAYVAVWHDIRLKLISWAALLCAILVPELLARRLWHTAVTKGARAKWSRRVVAAAGALNVYGMMAANLCGFACGLEGLRLLVERLMTAEGVAVLAVSYAILFSLVNVMLWIRQTEEGETRDGMVSRPVQDRQTHTFRAGE
ncbi:unnamed protein product [Vitrella brassicaformis CCMP3155]|uniref:Uncharacterized protein n=3 Tax=Vitrella brassicaformis TaxID=1169539 RepID=A0A0G4F432_VITBC|nr:unnamed protein product [Vitrella brassicaformis CCMP3155]|eukprot:CEM06476.1 unnamed protein product [Vitrella brassicaformis CCMP3155]